MKSRGSLAKLSHAKDEWKISIEQTEARELLLKPSAILASSLALNEMCLRAHCLAV